MTLFPQTVVVLVTPPGRGAVASVVVEGPLAATLVEGLFRPASGRPLRQHAARRIVFGRWGADHGEELVVSRWGDNRVDVHCHGGAAASRRIVRSLTAAGAIEISWQEWSRRREPDLVRAEALEALAAATAPRAAAVLLDQYAGVLSREIESLIAVLDESPQAPSAPAIARIEVLLRAARFGCRLSGAFQVVLCGPPNVGKSSLLNALLGYGRAIVYDAPGTTRDLVTATTAFDGWPVELCDTAGWREGASELEAAGIALARQAFAEADFRLLVFDASQPDPPRESAWARAWPDAITVFNKCDLAPTAKASPENLGTGPGRACRVSAKTGQGIDELAGVLSHLLNVAAPRAGAPVPFSPRQTAIFEQAERAAREGDCREAARRLRCCLRDSKS